MAYEIKKGNAPGWGEVDVLGTTYEAGKPGMKEKGIWRQKLTSREEKLNYIRSSERYWFSEEAFGSEKRKNPV